MKNVFGFNTVLAVFLALSIQSVRADSNAEMFMKLDANSDGVISMEEAEAHADLPDEFADGDLNDDGQLDQAEFAKLEITDE